MKKILFLLIFVSFNSQSMASEKKYLTPPQINNFMLKATMPLHKKSDAQTQCAEFTYDLSGNPLPMNITILQFMQAANIQKDTEHKIIVPPLNLTAAFLVNATDRFGIESGTLLINSAVNKAPAETTPTTADERKAPQAPHNSARAHSADTHDTSQTIVFAPTINITVNAQQLPQAKPLKKQQRNNTPITQKINKQRPLVKQEKDNLAIFVSNQINHAHIALDSVDFLDKMQELKQKLISWYRQENQHLDGNEIYNLIQQQFTKHTNDRKKSSSCICC